MTGAVSPPLEVALLSLRLLLAIVFATAGVAKLRDRAGVSDMLRAFLVPSGLIEPLAWLLPVAELAIAAALVPSASARWAGLAAAGMLAMFTAAIALQLARGRRPQCRCFGAIGAAPIGPSTLLRNLGLIVLALFLTFWDGKAPESFAATWLGDHTGWIAACVLLGGFGMAQTFLMFQILRQQGRLLLRLESIEGTLTGQTPQTPRSQAASGAGLPPGVMAPDFELPTLVGTRRALADFLVESRRVVLFFVHPACGPCTALLPDIARWRTELGNRFSIVVITEGNVEANRPLFADQLAGSVLLQTDRRVSDAYRAHGTPAAVVLEPDGYIASAIAMGADAIRALVAAASALPNVSPGQRAPEFLARGTGGELIRLADYHGRDVVILFWNPSCGFCRSIVEELLLWDQRNRLPLLVVSSGEDQELTERGLHAPFVIDDNAHISALFNAHGTPMAIRVNACGFIASDLAAGKDGVMRLLRQHGREASLSSKPEIAAEPAI